MPVWHEGTARWVKEGKLAILGVTHEQHADRCRLLAQWQGFDWPILHDPINLLEPAAVPILTAIDEHGIVRLTRPALKTFAADFMERTFADNDARPAPPRVGPALKKTTGRPDWSALLDRTLKVDSAVAWRDQGDALWFWGAKKSVGDPMTCYTRAVKLDPKDGLAWFRLGVCYRRRYESPEMEPGDFQAAIDHWSEALALDPNQYIWRRRIQQYGPRLDQPYSFYDWVDEAERAIRARDIEPVRLAVRPAGAEIAYPVKALPKPAAAARNPDPDGKVFRDSEGLIVAEVTVVPATTGSNKSARVHIVLRPNPKAKGHWNNEGEPLRLWVETPPGCQLSERLLEAPAPKSAVSDEPRTLTFEIVVAPAANRPRGAGPLRLPVYALYNVCEDAAGECRFLRLDIPVEVPSTR